MVWVPPGRFSCGMDGGKLPLSRPNSSVQLSGYWMDATEVTNDQFAAFVDATGYVTTAERPVDWDTLAKQLPPGTPKPPEEDLNPGSAVFNPPHRPADLRDFQGWWTWTHGAHWKHPEGPNSSIDGKGHHPVVHVSWDDANAYATWAGKRLPTENEWERAARFDQDGATFTWGHELRPDRRHMANIWQGHFPHKNTAEDGHADAAPVKSFPANSIGLYDMSGNVWEWTADRAGPHERVQKGGSYLCHDSYCGGYQPGARTVSTQDSTFQHVGFRCVSDAPPPHVDSDARWLSYMPAKDGPGAGRCVVFLAGDEEYRSEEALPMLARLFAASGFLTHVLFSQDPDSGEIDPDNRRHIPGLHLLQKADLCVMQWRFRDLPDEDMAHVINYIQSGKPITGIRTSTHAFDIPENRNSDFSEWSWTQEGDFGRQILGETWVAHHGAHGREATRGVIEEEHAAHPILRGVSDVFGPTDVYAIRSLPPDTTILLRGAVLEGMSHDDAPVADDRNDPMHPIAWIRNRKLSDGVTQRIFATTMGSARDWSSHDLRRMLLNAAYWQLGDEELIPSHGSKAPLIGHWNPTPFGFGTWRRGFTPSMIRSGHPPPEVVETAD